MGRGPMGAGSDGAGSNGGGVNRSCPSILGTTRLFCVHVSFLFVNKCYFFFFFLNSTLFSETTVPSLREISVLIFIN